MVFLEILGFVAGFFYGSVRSASLQNMENKVS
jgi:hypothetical protein